MRITTAHVTGRDLMAERVRFGFRAEDIAQAMQVSRARVSQLEALFRVPARQVDRYIDALRGLVEEEDLIANGASR